HSDSLAYLVSTSCQYLQSLTYPEPIEVGLHVKKLGNSSVTYGLAIFAEERKKAAAHGLFTHVYVDRKSNRPVSIPEATRNALQSLLVE
ncbi:acyl-CoA thioesterase, partial [bacterium]|nr:acyl-CoA thioesterase [bacterium]